MTDNFTPKDPEFTVTIVGPDGKEWINLFKKDGDPEWWGGKDKRDNYVNLNHFVKKEDRQQKQNQQQENKW